MLPESAPNWVDPRDTDQLREKLAKYIAGRHTVDTQSTDKSPAYQQHRAKNRFIRGVELVKNNLTNKQLTSVVHFKDENPYALTIDRSLWQEVDIGAQVGVVARYNTGTKNYIGLKVCIYHMTRTSIYSEIYQIAPDGHIETFVNGKQVEVIYDNSHALGITNTILAYFEASPSIEHPGNNPENVKPTTQEVG